MAALCLGTMERDVESSALMRKKEAMMNEAHGRRGAVKSELRHANAHRTVSKEIGREISERLSRLAGLLAEARGVAPTEPSPLDSVELNLKVSLKLKGGHQEAGVAIMEALDRAIHEGLRSVGAFQLGSVYCFLCNRPDCEHSVPVERTATFIGYAPNGKPEWRSFINVCIERREERVDQLYGLKPDVIAIVQEPDELEEGLLPDFGKGDQAYRLLGQVVAGLLPPSLDRSVRSETRIAMTLQLIETQGRGGGRRIRLNVLGLGLDDLSEAAAKGGPRSPAEALRRTLMSLRERVDVLGRRHARSVRAKEPLDLEAEVRPILRKLRSDIERIFRSSKRRTTHAEQRHISGERPTGDAMNDVAHASVEHFFHDTRRNTVVILGSRGRAHVFSVAGKHVTSLRLDPGELHRKTDRQRWTPLDPEAAIELRTRLTAIPGA